jgi:hypothetical protein
MTEYDVHPAALLCPEMTPEEYAALREDIREHGQRNDAVLLCGKLLDGRHRQRACKELSIELQCCELEPGTDPVAYVLSVNLHRRHLSRKQRNDLIKKLRAMGKTCQQIATATGVDKATVSRVVANATTESPATVRGKDGKKYPTKKRRKHKRRAFELEWCEVCNDRTVQRGETRCRECITETQPAQSPPAADVPVADPPPVPVGPPDVDALDFFRQAVEHYEAIPLCRVEHLAMLDRVPGGTPAGKCLVAFNAMNKAIEKFMRVVSEQSQQGW